MFSNREIDVNVCSVPSFGSNPVELFNQGEFQMGQVDEGSIRLTEEKDLVIPSGLFCVADCSAAQSLCHLVSKRKNTKFYASRICWSGWKQASDNPYALVVRWTKMM